MGVPLLDDDVDLRCKNMLVQVEMPIVAAERIYYGTRASINTKRKHSKILKRALLDGVQLRCWNVVLHT